MEFTTYRSIPSRCFDFVDHGFGVGRVIELQIKDGGLVFRPGQVLQSAQRNEFTRTLAMFDDAANAELGVQDVDRVADFGMFRLGKEVVDNDVIRPLKWSAFEVAETAGHAFIARQVNPGDDFQRTRRTDLRDDRSDPCHVRQLGEDVFHLDRHRRARQARDERRSRRQDDYVGADAGVPCALVLEHAKAKPDDQQNQCHLKRHRHNADQRPDRPMRQIPDDHPIHHVFIENR